MNRNGKLANHIGIVHIIVSKQTKNNGANNIGYFFSKICD